MKTTYELKIFCENIKYLRKTLKLSKKDMAKKLGIGVKSLTSIENGIVSNRISCKILEHIHNNFGISISGIFTPLENQENQDNY